MSTRDEVFTATRYFNSLEALGKALPDVASPPSTDAAVSSAVELSDSEVSHKTRAWLRELKETIGAVLPAGSYVISEIDQLIEKLNSEAPPIHEIKTSALELIKSARRLAQIRADDSVSTDLRRAVDLAVKEGYIESWPFRGILVAASILLVLFVGGNVFSYFQVQGIQQQADYAQRQIEQKLTAFNTQVATATHDIQASASQVNQQIDTKVATATNEKLKSIDASIEAAENDIKAKVKAFDTEKDRQVSALISAVAPDVAAAKEKILDYVRHAPDDARIDAERKDAIKQIQSAGKAASDAVGTELSNQLSAVRNADTNAISRIDATRDSSISAVGSYVSAVQSERDTAKSKITAATDQIEALRKSTETSINTAKDDVQRQRDGALQDIDKAVASVPARVIKLADNVTELNTLLTAYSEPISTVVDRLQERNPRSSVETIAAILGSATRLMIVAVAISLLALVLAGVACFWTQRLSHRIRPP